MSVGFRPLRREDFPLVSLWLAAPHVYEWWRQPYDADAVESEYGPVVDGSDPTEVFVVEADGHDIGLIQRYRLDDDPQWDEMLSVGSSPRPALGIDYLIGEESQIGHGLGHRIISGFVDGSWDRHPDARAVVVAVQQGNRRSWRALEKSGFLRDWSGTLRSTDPSDEGLSHVYVLLHAVRRSGIEARGHSPSTASPQLGGRPSTGSPSSRRSRSAPPRAT